MSEHTPRKKRRKSRKSSVAGEIGSLLASPRSRPSKKRKSSTTGQLAGINCFKEVRVEYPIHLSPSSIDKPLAGVIKILGRHLLRYSPEFDGIGLSIFDPFLLHPTASIISDQPYIHFTVTCKFLVFSPPIESKLVGVVHQIGFDYIALLVLGTFNVTISDQNLPFGFVRDSPNDSWTRTATEETIEVGTKILFTVKKIQKSADTISIIGSMKEGGTGILTKTDDKLVLNEFENLSELLAQDKGAELRRVIKKDPNDSQSDYESASDVDQTPEQPQKPEIIVPKSETMSSEDDSMGPPDTKPTKKRKKRSSSSGKTPKSKRRKSSNK